MSGAAAETWRRRRLMLASVSLATFDPHDYIRLNTDLAAEEPFRHFAHCGVWERRRCVSPERLTAQLSMAAALARPGSAGDDAAARYAWAWRRAATLTVHLRTPPGSGAEDAAYLCSGLLRGVGANVAVDRTLGKAPGPDRCEILFDAPRLFGGRRPEGAEIARVAAAGVWVDASPGEAGFDAALPYALTSGAAICREADAYAVFTQAGLPAVWVGRPPAKPVRASAPPDHPLLAGLRREVREAPPGLPWRERPIALAALEDATPARSAAWSRMAESLTDVALVLRRPAGPHAHLIGEAEMRAWVYARSRAVLHLNADAPRAVDSRSAADAAQAHAVLLAEPTIPHLRLQPGVQYAQADPRRMRARLAELDAAPVAAAAMAQALVDAQAQAFDAERLGLELVLALFTEPAA